MNHTALANKLTTPQLVSTYNFLGDKPIKKFSDRATAVKSTAKIMQDKNVKVANDLPKDVRSAIKDVISTLPKQRENKFPGPVSKFAGKKLYKNTKNNPRKEGSHGWKSFNIITDGMTYEDYRSSGGRTKDLNWDVKHKFVKVK